MSKSEELYRQLSEKLAEMELIFAKFDYEVMPTLLLRHEAGPASSILISNDDPSKVVLCIAEIADIGEVVEEPEPGIES